MRISTSMQYTNHLNYLQRANSSLDKASQRYNTGQKFQYAGEDPSGMSQKIRYEGDIEAYKQYLTNAGIASDTLATSEAALGSIWDVLSSVQTRLQQASNGIMDKNSRDAIAEDLEECRDQIFDLMNTKNAEGEYIFSGSKSNVQTMTLLSDGRYICQADGLERSVQISPTMTSQVSDSGLNIFQNVPLAHTITSTGAGGITLGDRTMILNYDDFEEMYTQLYTPAGPNDLTITVNNGTFTITGPGGVPLDPAGGEVTSDGLIEYKGMRFDIGDQNANGTINITMDPPQTDNILNQINVAIDALRNDDLSNSERTNLLGQAQVNVENAKDNVDMYRGRVGARAANIDNVINSNESMSVIKQEAKANVTEMDVYEAVSDLLREQNALSVSQQSFSIVHGSSLFDFI